MPIIASKTFSLAIVVQCSPLFTDLSFKSGDKLNMKSAALMHIKSETTIDMDATTEVDIDSALINLN